MNRLFLSIIATLMSLLAAVPALAQHGPRWGDDSGWERGHGMGGGMMGRLVAADVPDKLPVPKSREWTQKLQDVLALERLSYVQYTADAEKFNARMPYGMVIHQEEDHISTIERLFSAYGLPAGDRQLPLTDTKTIAEALELCVQLEKDLIPRYEWLAQNAEDRESAAILNELLFQTRHHMFMFQRALRMGGGMGSRDGGMGPGMMRNRY